MYSPKIREDLIPQLHRWAKMLNVPMTRLVNALLENGIARLEQGAENVHEAPARGYRPQQSRRRKAHGA